MSRRGDDLHKSGIVRYGLWRADEFPKHQAGFGCVAAAWPGIVTAGTEGSGSGCMWSRIWPESGLLSAMFFWIYSLAGG